MRTFGPRSLAVVFMGLAAASAACTVVLDHDATQCSTDADCVRFGGHPTCQAGVCVSSGLGPAGCYYGTPQTAAQFANQCSTAACLSFSAASSSDGLDAALVPPPSAEGGSGGATSDAGADGGATLPLCQDATSGRGQVVVMTGSSNFPPLLAKLAPLVHAAGYTPVFQVSSSCGGVASIFGATAGPARLVDPAPGTKTKPATYFAADGTSTQCSLGAAGLPVDVGESDIFSTTCAGFGAPGGAIAEYLGPIQAMTFVVPARSGQDAITAEAARAVFGMGGRVTPWTDPSLFFVRNANTGTQQMIGHAIDVPASGFWGTDRGTAAAVDDLLRVITDPLTANQAIGIISADYYDADRSNLKALAFAAPGQTCAYLPDSTPFSKDKRNVRDGHYPIWGPVHFFATVQNGTPVSAAALAFVSIVSVPNIPKSLLDAFIDSSLVPSCAMSVTRSTELGDLSAYAPPFECGCYFEASPTVSGAAPAGCARCSTSSDCADPKKPACNLGFCEAQ